MEIHCNMREDSPCSHGLQDGCIGSKEGAEASAHARNSVNVTVRDLSADNEGADLLACAGLKSPFQPMGPVLRRLMYVCIVH